LPVIPGAWRRWRTRLGRHVLGRNDEARLIKNSLLRRKFAVANDIGRPAGLRAGEEELESALERRFNNIESSRRQF
jgi:hypothetical protein